MNKPLFFFKNAAQLRKTMCTKKYLKILRLAMVCPAFNFTKINVALLSVLFKIESSVQ